MNADDARATVQRLAREGVNVIKVVSDSAIVPIQMPDEVLASIIAQAHRDGLEVIAHMSDARRMMTAARLGLDGFVHPPEPPPAELPPDFADLLVQQGMSVTTILAGFAIILGAPGDAFEPGSEFRRNTASAARALAALVQQGVPLVLGTDWCACGRGLSYPALQAGSATLTEMEILTWGGLSAASVLAAATINAARALGLDTQLGTIEVGKVADLLIVAGNPLDDIAQVRNTRLVVQSGRVAFESEP